ncbi:MAG: cytochrome c [Nitrospira sp.]|nr:cytochrome c [Nitrospira sp.]
MPTRFLILAISITLISLSAAPTTAGQADDAQALRDHYELQDGKRLYEEFCRFCHGQQGKGKAYNQVSPPPPDLTAPAVQRKSNAELGNIIHDGEPGSPMGAWKWTLSEQDKRNVLLYIRSLAQ